MPAELVYAFDPLCGWCFAFRSSIAAVRAALGERVTWRLACGGLVTGEREVPIRELAGYLRRGMAAVEARTGARFGPAFVDGVLADGAWVSRSEPACRATLVVERDHGGAAAVDFGGELSRAFYEDGRLPDARDTIVAVGAAVGLDGEAVARAWEAPEARARTEAAFRDARRAGIGSYPMLLVARGDSLVPVVPGWAPPETTVEAVRRAVEHTPPTAR